MSTPRAPKAPPTRRSRRAGGGIRSTVAATAAGSLGDLVDAARERARRMLLLGTTTVEVKSGYGQTLAAELRQLEAARSLAGEPGLPDVIPTYLPLHGPVGGDRAEYLEVVLRDGLPARRPAGELRRLLLRDRSLECRRSASVCSPQAGPPGWAPRSTPSSAATPAGRRWRRGWGRSPPTTWITPPTATCAASRRRRVAGVLLPGASLVLGGPPATGTPALGGGGHAWPSPPIATRAPAGAS